MKKKKVIMISSSGGHYEQLNMLKPLSKEFDLVWITERTNYEIPSDYKLIQTGLRDKLLVLKMCINMLKSIYLFIFIRPSYIVTTGTIIAFPFALISKITRCKFIYIETFARVTDGTKSGRLMYRMSDLFIIQWKSLESIYPKAVFGGSIY